MKRSSAIPPESGPAESGPGPAESGPAGGESTPDNERRFMRGVVHDHKGTAHLQWYDVQLDYERQLLELEDKTHSAETGKHKLDTGGLSVKEDDSFDPYTRKPETERKRNRGTRTDLRRLSAWIKMMRELEQARKRDEDEDSDG
ncbi:MAG: hypothetical protein JOZ12_01695 [Sinobacteraceae bacterium]|nr:hypothetical protein [Nevskiaceae bacterium]